jgi:hypothetical protein
MKKAIFGESLVECRETFGRVGRWRQSVCTALYSDPASEPTPFIPTSGVRLAAPAPAAAFFSLSLCRRLTFFSRLRLVLLSCSASFSASLAARAFRRMIRRFFPGFFVLKRLWMFLSLICFFEERGCFGLGFFAGVGLR